MPEETPITHRAGETCVRCDDKIDGRSLAAAVRVVRTAVNDTLDDIEKAAVKAQGYAERRVTGL